MKLLAVAIIGLCVVIGINRHEINKQQKRIKTLEDITTDYVLKEELYKAFDDESEEESDVKM